MTAYEAITAVPVLAAVNAWMVAKYRRKRSSAKELAGNRPQVVVVDYSEARAKAIEWLGDRYLLAKPINRRRL